MKIRRGDRVQNSVIVGGSVIMVAAGFLLGLLAGTSGLPTSVYGAVGAVIGGSFVGLLWEGAHFLQRSPAILLLLEVDCFAAFVLGDLFRLGIAPAATIPVGICVAALTFSFIFLILRRHPNV